MTVRTASEIVALIRATQGSEFALSGSEAELLVNLFASGAAAEEGVRAAQQTSERIISSLGSGRSAA